MYAANRALPRRTLQKHGCARTCCQAAAAPRPVNQQCHRNLQELIKQLGSRDLRAGAPSRRWLAVRTDPRQEHFRTARRRHGLLAPCALRREQQRPPAKVEARALTSRAIGTPHRARMRLKRPSVHVARAIDRALSGEMVKTLTPAARGDGDGSVLWGNQTSGACRNLTHWLIPTQARRATSSTPTRPRSPTRWCSPSSRLY